MTELITIVVSAAVGAVVAYLGAIWQTRLEARRFIHESIHENRVRLYPNAWEITGELPLRPITKAQTYKSVTTLAIKLRDWYYSGGGMYLSGEARRAYSACQDTLYEITERCADDVKLSDVDYEKARKACSFFRTWLTRDILSRSRAPMGRKWDP